MGFVLDAYAARSCPLKTVYRFTPGLEPPRDRLPDPPFFHDADAIEASVFARLLASDDEAVDLRTLPAPDAATAERATIDRPASRRAQPAPPPRLDGIVSPRSAAPTLFLDGQAHPATAQQVHLGDSTADVRSPDGRLHRLRVGDPPRDATP